MTMRKNEQPMTWQIFKREASKYFSIDATTHFALPAGEESKLHQLHCVMGISIGVADLMNAITGKDDEKVTEIIGELFFYTANLERFLGIRQELPKGVNGIKVYPDEWLVGMMEVMNHYKDSIFFMRYLDKEYMEQHIAMVKHTLCGLAVNGGQDVVSIMEMTLKRKAN